MVWNPLRQCPVAFVIYAIYDIYVYDMFTAILNLKCILKADEIFLIIAILKLCLKDVFNYLLYIPFGLLTIIYTCS